MPILGIKEIQANISSATFELSHNNSTEMLAESKPLTYVEKTVLASHELVFARRFCGFQNKFDIRSLFPRWGRQLNVQYGHTPHITVTNSSKFIKRGLYFVEITGSKN